MAKKGKTKKKKQSEFILPAVFVGLLFIILLLWAISQDREPEPINETETEFEMTQVDVFSRELRDTITSDMITVFGLELGDRFEQVFFVLGEPDNKTEFPAEDIINLEYGESIGLEKTGIILHFDSYVLTRITFYEPFNKYLIGDTQINHTKREIYDMFGIREREYNIPTRPFETRVLVYDTRGIEFYIDKYEVGFSLFPLIR